MLEAVFSAPLRRSATFITELLLANAIFFLPFGRKRLFWLRLFAAIVIMLCASAAIFYLTEGSIYNHILSFAFSLGFTLLIARFCFDINWPDAAFCVTAGYSVQFIGSIISEFVQRAFDLQRWPREILIVSIVYVVMYRLFGRQIKRGRNLDISRIFQYFLLTAAVLTDIVICGVLRPYWLKPENRVIMICSMILLFLCSFLILILQFSLLSRKTLADELAVVDQLMKKEKAQYAFSRETIDSINRKCHDMRHQIRMIGSQEHIDPEAIHEMTDAINIYDGLYKTGNQALDTILAEKALYCQDNKISINCMADGKKLGFMRDTDIYSLFGNMIENALLAVAEVSEESRDIYLSVISKGELLSIHSHNPYSGIVRMREGLPVTKNTDTANHGLGTKSIQFIVEKYNGTVSFEAKDGIFYVDILFPIE